MSEESFAQAMGRIQAPRDEHHLMGRGHPVGDILEAYEWRVLERGIGRVATPPLGNRPHRLEPGQRVVVVRKPSVEPVLPSKDVVADHGARDPALARHVGTHGRGRLRQPGGVVDDSKLLGIPAGQQCAHGGESERAGRIRQLENLTLCGKAVEMRCQVSSVSVGAQVIGPEGIHGNEHEGRGRRSLLP